MRSVADVMYVSARNPEPDSTRMEPCWVFQPVLLFATGSAWAETATSFRDFARAPTTVRSVPRNPATSGALRARTAPGCGSHASVVQGFWLTWPEGGPDAQPAAKNKHSVAIDAMGARFMLGAG